MAMDLGGAKGGVKSDINVTPLVDVMLVLLIIMMLVAPMLQQGVAVKLPTADQHGRQARDAGPDRRRRSTRTSAIYLNAKPVPEARARRRRSTSMLENKKEKIVLIKADEDVAVRRRHGGDGPAPAGRHRGHRPHHRARRSAGRPAGGQ